MSRPTPFADQFVIHLTTTLAAHQMGQLSAAETAMNIIEYLADESNLEDIDTEYDALVLAQEPRPLEPAPDFDYDQLRRELQRVSAAQRLINHPRGLLGDK